MELQEFKDMLRIDGNYDDANLMIHLESAKAYVLNSINVKTTEQESSIFKDARFKMVVGLLAATWYEAKTLTSTTEQHTLPHSFYPLIQQLDFLAPQATEPEPEPTEPEPEPTEPSVETVDIKINGVAYKATAKNEMDFTLLNGETFDTPFLNVDGTEYGVISSTPEQTVLTAIESYWAQGEWGDMFEWTGYVKDLTLYVFSGKVLEKGLNFAANGTRYTLVSETSSKVWTLEEEV
ncbi:head-tail connector protein [Kurthia massiliensis]|uniref:head-tail connector protein n=1 Tax=Kurthia massiliensis TaxID=1033739 RepID=UPI000288AE5D|nr:head-tail connector protein [Kurthia massiliensis]